MKMQGELYLFFDGEAGGGVVHKEDDDDEWITHFCLNSRSLKRLTALNGSSQSPSLESTVAMQA